MAAPTEWKIESLIAEIQKSPGKYSTDFIISILQELVGDSEKYSGRALSLKFTNSRKISIAANRFTEISRSKDVSTPISESIVLEGGVFDIGGAASPFPAQLFDEVLKDFKIGNKVALEFLDIFVDRLTKIDFAMRDKVTFHKNTFNTEQKPSFQIVEQLATIQEKFYPMPDNLKHFDFLNLKQLSFRKPISAHVTKRILQALFGCDIKLEQNTLRYLNIPKSARCHLSSVDRGSLGLSSFIGKYRPTFLSGLDIQVEDLNCHDADALVKEPVFIENMRILFRALYPCPIRVKLKIFRNFGTGATLGEKIFLGFNSWLNAEQADYQPVTLTFNSWENHLGR